MISMKDEIDDVVEQKEKAKHEKSQQTSDNQVDMMNSRC